MKQQRPNRKGTSGSNPGQTGSFLLKPFSLFLRWLSVHRSWPGPPIWRCRLIISQCRIGSKPNGFTMTEALMALLTAGLCAMCLGSVLQADQALVRMEQPVQNSLGLLQLRQRAAVSTSLQCSQERLVMIRSHEEYSLIFSNDRLVQTPGFEIFMEHLEEGRFACEEDSIWLETDRGSWQIR